MKRSIVFFAIVGLTLTSLALPASGAIKAGAKCPKPGISIKVNNAKYSCVKVGKNLVWRKAKKANSASSAAPTTPIQPIESKPVRPTTLINLDPSNTLRIVMQEFLEYSKTTSGEVPIEFKIGSNLNPKIAEFLKSGIQSANIFFGNRFQDQSPKHVLFGNEKDVSFVSGELTKLGETEWARTIEREIANRGSSFTHGSARQNITVIMFHSSFDYEGISYYYSDLAVHEFAHIYQFDKQNRQAMVQTGANAWGTYGCLWLEGHAEFIAQYRVWPDEKDLDKFRNYYFNRDITNDYKLSLDTKEKIMSYLKASEDVVSSGCKGMYSIGTMALEGLVAVHGLAKLHDFYVLVADGTNRNKAFQDTFKLSMSEYYDQIATYILSVQKKYGVVK